MSLACLFFSAIVRAQTPALVAPKQTFAPALAYPEGATGEATVVLKIVVGADGSVTKVEVESGAEPFASAATANVKQWRFEPATRDGAAIKASVRARVTFHPPTSSPTPTPSPSPSPSTSAKPTTKPKPGGAFEIEIEGTRPEVGQTTTTGAEIRILPGAFGDPFRAIEIMPGIVPIASGVPYFYVRGAPPGDVGYFIDGVPVPMLFHLGAGPAIIAPALIDRVDFFPGGYPARYGRFAGGIVAGETKEPEPRPHGEWQVRLFDASAMVEAPLDDQKTDVLVAGRYGYPGLVLSLISPDLSLQYWDYQLRLGRKISDRDRLSVFVFGAYDRLYDKKHEKTLFDTQFHRVDARWDRALDRGAFRLAATVGYEETAVGDNASDTSDDVAVRTYLARVRAELEERLSDEVKLRAGADAELQHHRLIAGATATNAEQDFPSRDDFAAGVRWDFVIHPFERVEIVPGARLDVFHEKSTTIPAAEPRLATRVGVTKHAWWLSTWAIAHQPPAFFVPLPGLQPDLSGGLQESFQTSEGIELELPWKVTSTVTAFHHTMLHLTDFLATCVGAPGSDPDVRKDFCDVNARASGRTIGLEVLVRRPLTEKFGFWIAYTLSRAERTFQGVTSLSTFDRTHVLSVVGSWDLGHRWRFGGRFTYMSGRPVLTDAGDVRRLPDFWRVDLRLEKRWQMTQTSWITLAFEMFDVFFEKEATDWKCDSTTSKCTPDEIGPVTIPSIGVEGGF